jgi:hypothetical protein
MEGLYSPKAYYSRCEMYLNRVGTHPKTTRTSTLGELGAMFKAFWHVGILSPRRRYFWRLMIKALPHGPQRIRQSVVHAVQGEHLIRYTQEHVVPQLKRAAEQIRLSAYDGTIVGRQKEVDIKTALLELTAAISSF